MTEISDKHALKNLFNLLVPLVDIATPDEYSVSPQKLFSLVNSAIAHSDQQDARIAELEDERDQLASLYDDRGQEIAELNQPLANAAYRIAELEQQLEERNTRTGQQARQIDDLRQQLAKAKSDLASDDELNELAATVQHLETELGNRTDAYTRRGEAIRRLKAERDAEREMVLDLLENWMDSYYNDADEIEEDTYSSTREFLIEHKPNSAYPLWEQLWYPGDDYDDYPTDEDTQPFPVTDSFGNEF